MADKLIKSFEALRIHYVQCLTIGHEPQPSQPPPQDVGQKKKDTLLSLRERISYCNAIADFLPLNSIREFPDFPKLLSISIELLLWACDDSEADVRLVAGEAINKIIKAFLDTNIGRIQVELYKEIKKNGPARPLKAAMQRFCDTCHMIRSQKCKPYVANLLPCLVKIAKRVDDSIQETLGHLMLKLCPVLGPFFSEDDVKILLKTFIPNSKSTSAVIRRAAACSLNAVCEFSRNPEKSYAWLINVLLGLVVPLSDEEKSLTILGALMCFRQLIPNLECSKSKEHTLKGSFGRTLSSPNDKGTVESLVTEKQLLQIYEVSMYCTKHKDHNIVTSALEVLQQLLLSKPQALVNILLSPDGISPTVSNQTASPDIHPEIEVDEDAVKADLKEEFKDSVLEDDLQSTTTTSGVSDLSELTSNDFEDDKTETSSLSSTSMTLEQGIQSLGDKFGKISGKSKVRFHGTDEVKNFVEQGEDVEEDKLVLPRTYTQESRASAVSDLPDAEGENTEMEEFLRNSSVTSYEAAVAIERHFNIDAVACTGVPLIHCIRLMCSFLLEGKPGSVLSDANTRVSVKSLALSCIGHSLMMYPEALLAYVLPDVETNGGPKDVPKQYIRDILLLQLHSDPQIRGNLAVIAGSFLRGALQESRGNYDKWCSEIAQVYKTECLPVETLINVINSVLVDESAIASKLACTSLKNCIEQLCRSSYSFYGISLIRQMLLLQNTLYWLTKVELMETLATIDYRLIHVIELKAREDCGKYPLTSLKFNGIQDEVLETIFLVFLGDEDARVRLSASQCLVNVIPNLSFVHCGSLATLQQEVLYYQGSRNGMENIKTTTEAVQFIVDNKSMLSSNLSYVIRKIITRLNGSKTKFLTHGCCQVLTFLSEMYPVSLCLAAWEILPPFAFSAKPAFRDRTLSLVKTGSPRRLNFGEVFNCSVGPLAAAFSLMSTTWMTSDLQAHQEVLKFCVNVLIGAASQRLQEIAKTRKESLSPDNVETFGVADETWGALRDSGLVTYASRLFQHCMRLLSMIMHVIDQTNPGASSSKLQISFAGGKDKQAAPVPGTVTPENQQQGKASPGSGSSHSSSPRKFLLGRGHQRRAMSEVDLATYDKSPVAKVMDRTPGVRTTENLSPTSSASDSKLATLDGQQNLGERNDKIGSFHCIPHLMRTFEVLKGSHRNYQATPVGKRNDKFYNFVVGVVESFSLLLEIATFSEVGTCAEEILEYLQSCVKVASEITFLAVQQLLKSLFGTNAGTQPENYILPYSTKHLVETRGDPTFWINSRVKIHSNHGVRPSVRRGLYENFFQRVVQSSGPILPGDTQKSHEVKTESQEKSSFSLFKKFRKPAAVPKPASKFSKEKITSIQSYIRLFEPLVIHALKTYTMTSCLGIQCQVIHLLDQLIHLRVNYSLLDADQIFIGYVLKQFEFVESGQIRLPQIFVPEVFQFLVLLSYECFQPKFTQAKAIISMPQIIQLCDGLMACGQPATTNAIPALQPIVHDLFVARGQGRPDSRKELDTQREVVVSMLTRLIQFPKVIGMMVTVLEGSKEDDEKWRRLSRQFIDMLFPRLASLKVHIDCQEHLAIVHRLLDTVAPVAIRPADIILKTLFTPVTLNTLTDTLRWLSMVIVMTRALFVQNSEDVILARLQIVSPCDLSKMIDKHKPDETAETRIAHNEQNSKDPSHADHLCLYFFQAIRVATDEITMAANDPNVNGRHLNFLFKLLNHLLSCLIGVFKSGKFTGLQSAAKYLIDGWSCQDLELRDESPKSLLSAITSSLFFLEDLWPSSAFLWLNIIASVGFECQDWWHRIILHKNEKNRQETQRNPLVEDPDQRALWSDNLINSGALILYCQHLHHKVKNDKATYIPAVRYLLESLPREILYLEHEEPVNDLLGFICEDSELSGLFVAVVSQMFKNDSSEEKELLWSIALKPLENTHLSQSGDLLQLLLEIIPTLNVQGLARKSETLACRRLQYILSLPANLRNSGLPFNFLQKFVDNKVNEIRFQCLHMLSEKAIEIRTPLQKEDTDICQSDPLGVGPIPEGEMAITKDWLILFAENISQNRTLWTTDQIAVCVELMKVLDIDDLTKIFESENFDAQLLLHCLAAACQLACNGAISNQEVRNEELTTSLDLSGSLMQKQHAKLLYFGKSILIKKIESVVAVTVKPVDSMNGQDHGHSFKDMQFTSIREDVVFNLFDDKKTWENLLVLNKCSSIFLAPCCYQNRRWGLQKEEILTLMFFAFVSLVACRNKARKKEASYGEMNTCFENVAMIFHTREFWNDVIAKENTELVATAVDDVYNILTQVALETGEKLAQDVHPYFASLDGYEEVSLYFKACEKISELVHSLRTRFKSTNQHDHSRLPNFFVETVRRLIIGFARHPLVNCYARVPPLVWKMGWAPKAEGFFSTELPPLPIDILKEKDVLTEFVLRVNLIGWTSRPQFEETWAALLGVLSSPPVADDTAVEEEIEAAQSSCLAVHCITSLLLDTTLAPVPGNCAISRHSVIHRQRDYPFVGSRAGKKLSNIRRRIETEYKSRQWYTSSLSAHFAIHEFLYPVMPSLLAPKQRKQHLYHGCLMEEKLYSYNLEFPPGPHGYLLGQISSSAIRIRLISSDVQEDTDSDDSEALIIQLKGAEISSNKVEELDIRSCLQFLLELFEQWLSDYTIPKSPLMMKTEAVKSLCLLSDLLLELNHFEWILGVLLDFYQTHPVEDDILNQYLVPSVCKACAVLKLEGNCAEKVCKIVETALKSPHVPLQASAITGGLYLMESQVASTTAMIVPMLTDFLTKQISNPSDDPEIRSQRLSIIVWSASFYIVELCATDIQDQSFVQNVIETSMVYLSDPHMRLPTDLGNVLLRGLERLVVSFSLTRADCDRIAKVVVRCLAADNPDRFASTLGLLCTCMYTGKEGEHPSGLSHPELVVDSPINDSRLVVMERLGALIVRIRKGTSQEGNLIAKILPAMLTDFLPVQEIMNKVISEFLSSQQPKPELIAQTAYETFDRLHRQGQQETLRDWILLSIGSFLQRTPLAMAVWSLSCFFVSVSTNQWIHALFPYVLSRKGKLDSDDKRIFCMVAIDFYQNQNLDDVQRRMFLNTFQAKAELGSPYQELVAYCTRLK